jgi:purine nucleosidase
MAKYWIDTDTGSDDAVALMMAFKHIPSEIVGISTVAGNVPLDLATINASYTARLCGAEIPIHVGAAAPLSRPLRTAQHVHGQDGMGDIGLDLGMPETCGEIAATALIAAIKAHPGELELITLGPLTNIALPLHLDPSIAEEIKRITIMGGTSDYYGNITAVSEYNMWVDPEAAHTVFTCAAPKFMIGWDISRKFAAFNDAEADELLAIGTERARVAIESQTVLREFCRTVTKVDGLDLPDPIALAAAIHPDVITASTDYAVSVCCDDGPTRGMTILSDRHAGDAPKSTEVATEANRALFLEMLRAALV